MNIIFQLMRDSSSAFLLFTASNYIVDVQSSIRKKIFQRFFQITQSILRYGNNFIDFCRYQLYNKLVINLFFPISQNAYRTTLLRILFKK